MRPGIIIAIIGAVVIAIIGIVWYNNQSDHARLEEQRTEQAARDADLARQEEEAAATEQARQAEEAAAQADQASAVDEDASAVRDDDAIVVGDEITEDTIVMESISDDPVVLDPAETTATSEIDTAEPADSTGTLETGSVGEAGGETQNTGEDGVESIATADTGNTATSTTDPEELLTPTNFNHDEVLALIDDSDQLTTNERSTLRAVVEGTRANPAMVDAAIESIRAALDLPPLN